MNDRFRLVAACAAANHSVVSFQDLDRFGVDRRTSARWVRSGFLVRLGPHSYAVAGSSNTWHRRLAAGLADLGDGAAVAGRSAARLYELDGFTGHSCEFLVDRSRRHLRTAGRVAATGRAVSAWDVGVRDGLRVLRPERLILDSPRFGFTRHEIENAIDSAIRLRLVSERRLRTRVSAEHCSGVNGSRALLDALVDTGGESRLERMFLRLVREAGLPRPRTQRVERDGTRVVARVDFELASGVIVEVYGHASHSTRRQMQRDAQRITELALRGRIVLVFTYDDVRYRPDWVIRQLMAAGAALAA